MTIDERSMSFATELARSYATLRERSFEELERELEKLEALWTARVGEPEAREIRRRIAEEMLMGAYVRGVEWLQFSRALERVRALGYSNVERVVHVACVFARWAHGRREHEQEARIALDEAERQAIASNQEGCPLLTLIETIRTDTGYR